MLLIQCWQYILLLLLPQRCLVDENILDVVHSDMVLLLCVGLCPLKCRLDGRGLTFEVRLTIDALLESEVLVDIWRFYLARKVARLGVLRF